MLQLNANTPTKKVIVIGFDGAEMNLIDAWVSQGKLPNFARLMEMGACGPMKSTPDAMSPSAWTSFATGKNPGKHGIYNFMDFVQGSLKLRYNDSRNRDGETVWTLADKAEKRSVVLNVPMTFPADPINGLMISGWTAPSINNPGFTHPPALINKLIAEHGEFALFPTVKKHISEGHPLLGVQSLKADLKSKKEISLQFLKNETWDLFISFFIHTDQVQHYYWHFMDPTHPDHDPDGPEPLADAVYNIYRECDTLLGDYLEQMDGDTTLLVMSDHGHGPNHGTVEYLPLWLKDMGFSVDLPVQSSSLNSPLNIARSGFVSAMKWAYNQFNKHLDVRMKSRLNKLFPKLRDKVESTWRFGSIDWSKTTVFFHYEPRINLKGREPEGIVEPGKDYEDVRDRLIEKLLNIRDPKTGERIVEKVIKREEVFHGPHIDSAPDIIIRWKENCVVSGLSSIKDDGTLIVSDKTHIRDDRSGHHTPYGILFAAGQAIKPGHRFQKGDISIMDLAPTILYLMGVPVPGDMDGTILLDCIDPDYLDANPIRNADSTTGTVEHRSSLSEEDEQKIKDHLKALGYLE